MLFPFRFTYCLIAASPAFVLWDSPITRAVLAGCVAFAAAWIAWAIRPGQGSHLTTVTWPVAAMSLIAVAWILVQIVPLPVQLSSIWVSAREALNERVLGTISIDPGATIVALSQFLSVLMIMFLTAAVSIERERAESMLLLLTAITAVVATIRIGAAFGAAHVLGEIETSGTASHAISALGVIIAAAAAIHCIERLETRHRSADRPSGGLKARLALSFCGLAICLIAVITFAARPVIFATACGFAMIIWIFVARRFVFGALMRTALAVLGVGAVTLLAVADRPPETLPLSLRFAASPSSAAVAVAQRMISDTSWTGSGAGSYPMLFRIYRSSDEMLGPGIVPTTVAKLGVELGWPALWAAGLMMIAICYLLVRGSLLRIRDSAYATAASAVVVLVTLEAFIDNSLANSAVVTIAAVVVGLGLVQSASRVSRETA